MSTEPTQETNMSTDSVNDSTWLTHTMVHAAIRDTNPDAAAAAMRSYAAECDAVGAKGLAAELRGYADLRDSAPARDGLPTSDLHAALEAADVDVTATSTGEGGRSFTVHFRATVDGQRTRRQLAFHTEDPHACADVHLLTANGVCLASLTLHAKPTAPLLAVLALALLSS